MKLSEKLIALRKEKGWSQEDFAEKLDVSRQAISRWENGTALPDAQNIMRISKLFNVTADYLLNEHYECGTDIPVSDTATEEIIPTVRKKKYLQWYLIRAFCIIIVSVCGIMGVVKIANNPTEEAHTHPELIRVVENEVAPTCTEQGAYDEVLYCAECGEEVLRTRISKGTPAHQFQNEKCIICGEVQRARDS